jgi:hypothetical protein
MLQLVFCTSILINLPHLTTSNHLLSIHSPLRALLIRFYSYEEALEFLKNGFQGPRSDEENKVKVEEVNIDYRNVVNDKKEEVKEEVRESNLYMRLPNKKDERAQMM